MKIVGGSTDPGPAQVAFMYQASETRSVGMSIPLDSAGKIRIKNYSPNGASVNIRIDVQGYFSPSSHLGFHSASQEFVFNSQASGVKVAGKSSVRVSVASATVPADRVEAAVVTVTAQNWASAGSVKVYPTHSAEPATSQLLFRGDAAASVSATAFVQLGSYRQLTIKNLSADPVHLKVSLQGWFESYSVDHLNQNYGRYTTLASATPVLAGYAPAIEAQQSRTISVANSGGVPAADAETVANAVQVRIRVRWASPVDPVVHVAGGFEPEADAEVPVGFKRISSDMLVGTVTAPLDVNGSISVRNGSPAAVPMEVDVLGWFTLSQAEDDPEVEGADPETETVNPAQGEVDVVANDDVAALRSSLTATRGAPGVLTNSFLDYDAVTWGGCGAFTDKDKKVRAFQRRYYFANQVGGHVTLRCGNENYGFRHIKERHASQIQNLFPSTNWRNLADWLAGWTLKYPTKVSFDSNRGSYCYSRSFKFIVNGDEVTRRWARIISGKTSQRFITIFVSSKKPCGGVNLMP